MKSLFLGALLLVAPLHASAQTIKLGTLAPDGSTYHVLLRELGEKWAAASGGKVKVKIYPGGIVGNESDMVKKLRVGNLNAALLTGIGIRDIDPAVQTMQVPLMLKDYAELDYVQAKMAPKFEQIMSDKGFVVLFWGDAGWVNFFSQKPVRTPADMKGVKVFAWSGDEAAVEAWKIAGFTPVVISSTDITTSLQTGLIQSVDTTPLAALSFQWYRHAKHMTDVKWAPLVGALFVSKKTWETVPAELRPTLLGLARELGEKAKTEIRKLGEEAVSTMKKEGLEVTVPNAQEFVAWQTAAEQAYPYIRERVVPTATFDEIKKLRDDYRSGKR